MSFEQYIKTKRFHKKDFSLEVVEVRKSIRRNPKVQRGFYETENVMYIDWTSSTCDVIDEFYCTYVMLRFFIDKELVIPRNKYRVVKLMIENNR